MIQIGARSGSKLDPLKRKAREIYGGEIKKEVQTLIKRGREKINDTETEHKSESYQLIKHN